MYRESDEDEDEDEGEVWGMEMYRRRMERKRINEIKRLHSWSCCGCSFDFLGCTSGKLVSLGEEEIQKLIDENDEMRESILADDDSNDNNNDDDDFGYDSDDYDSDGNYRGWDESIGGGAKRWCGCGYKEGHSFYCCC